MSENTSNPRYHTFLIQNNVSKKVYSWILEDLTPGSIYHKFDIALDPETEDGEYQYILFLNPNRLEIEVDVNDIFESYLIGGETTIETFGVLRIGDYKCPIHYDKEQSYITYNSR